MRFGGLERRSRWWPAPTPNHVDRCCFRAGGRWWSTAARWPATASESAAAAAAAVVSHQRVRVSTAAGACEDGDNDAESSSLPESCSNRNWNGLVSATVHSAWTGDRAAWLMQVGCWQAAARSKTSSSSVTGCCESAALVDGDGETRKLNALLESAHFPVRCL